MEKQTSSANRLVLKQILAREGNNRCADCKTATHPRWASWNIGVLICISCSGVHRSLGTHISKTRSIDLDTWNDQQLEKLVEIGNTKANAYWEAQLPDGYVPDSSKIYNFIKTKYELKRWVPKKGTSASAASKAVPKAEDKPPAVPPKIRNVDLLDLDEAFASPRTAPPVTKASSSAGLTSSLANLSTGPAANRATPPFSQTSRARPAEDDLIDSFSRSTPRASITSLKSNHSGTHGSSASSSTTSLAQGSRVDVKKSILSLYSQPSSTTSLPSMAAVPPVPPMTASPMHPVQPISQPKPTISRAARSQPQPASRSTPHQAPEPTSQPASLLNLDDGPAQEDDNFASVWN